MYRVVPLFVITVIATACSRSADSVPDTTAATGVDTAGQSTGAGTYVISHRGMPPVMVGMTIAEASTAARTTLSARGDSTATSCTYVDWPGGPAGIGLMAEGGRIVRIDIEDSTIATTEGARVGDSEDRVSQLYAGRVTTTPHKYEPTGKYLTVAAPSPSDSSYRMVFESDSGRIVRYRVGVLPAVEYVERCG